MATLEQAIIDAKAQQEAEPQESSTPDYLFGEGLHLTDADTYSFADGRRVRMANINAGETAKFLPGKTVSGEHLGAELQREKVRQLIKEHGFTDPVLSGNKDRHGRIIGDLRNAEGELLSSRIAKTGIVNLYDVSPEARMHEIMGARDRRERLRSGEATDEDKMLQRVQEERFKYGVSPKLRTGSALEYGAAVDDKGKSDYFAGPSYVRGIEDRQGHAKSTWAGGWNIGEAKAIQGVYDSIDALGKATGSQFLMEFGKNNGDRIQTDLEYLPTLKNGEALDANGNWKLKGFSEIGDYTLGMMAQSMPNMIASLGAAALAAPTYGTSLLGPAAIYTGNTYREQKDKNPYTAALAGVSMMMVEKLGVTGVFTSAFTKSAQSQIINQLMLKGHTQEVAEKMFMDSAKIGIKEVSDAMKTVRGSAIGAATKGAAKGVLGEAPEEVLQEVIQYAGSKSSLELPTSDIEIRDLKNRMIAAGVGGAFLGAGFGAGSSLVARSKDPHSGRPTSTDAEYRAKLFETEGVIQSAQQEIGDAEQALAQAGYDAEELVAQARPEVIRSATQGPSSNLQSWWRNKGLKSLHQAWSRTVVGVHEHAGPAMAALSTMIGANKSLNGGSIDEQQHNTSNDIRSAFGSIDKLKEAFPGLDRQGISDILRDPEVIRTISILSASKKSGNKASVRDTLGSINVDKLLSGNNLQHKEAIIDTAEKISSFVSKYNKWTGQKLTVEELLSNKPLNKSTIAGDVKGFARTLSDNFKVSLDDAMELTHQILDNKDIHDVDDTLDDFLNGGNKFTQIRQSLLTNLNKPGMRDVFAKYMSHDVYDMLVSKSDKGGSIFVNKNLIGKDGSKLAALLQMAELSGEINGDRKSFMAKELSDWLAMRRGEYKPIKNEYVKGALNTLNFLSTIAALPLAAISSTVEFAQIYRNLNTEQSLKATKELLSGFGSEFAHIYKSFNNTPDTSDYREAIGKHGYLNSGSQSAQYDNVQGYYRKWTEGFFKLTGLTSVTNVTRYARLAIGADAINNWLNIYRETPESQEGKDAYSHLIRVGVDVGFMMNATDSTEDQQRFNDEMTKGVHAFVQEAVIQPTMMNRPKFYSDPYLQIFTQFQGYTSTFTANVLPRLLKDLNRHGSTDQVNAAATIAMMFALAYLAVFLKDMIKYGESPPEWLKKDKEFQRYIGQVGLLGTGQRLWDAASPVIPNNQVNSSVFETILRGAADQAPVISYLNKIDDAISAKDGKRIEKASRLLPVFGTSPQFAKYLQKELGE